MIRTEKRSGTTREGRTELATLLEFLHAGDTLVVTRVDRLARSIGDLQDVVRALKAKGVALRATEQPIDTTTAAGKAFLDMLGVRRVRDQPAPRAADGRHWRRQGARRLQGQGPEAHRGRCRSMQVARDGKAGTGGLSIGIERGPSIGVQKGPLRWLGSALPVGPEP